MDRLVEQKFIPGVSLHPEKGRMLGGPVSSCPLPSHPSQTYSVQYLHARVQYSNSVTGADNAEDKISGWSY